MSNYLWPTVAQVERLKPFFPKARGRARVDDRQLLSGIIYVQHNGLMWKDVPAVYGRPETLYNRWKRWSSSSSKSFVTGRTTSMGAGHYYSAALKDIGAEDRQVTGRWETNRVENSPQPFRRRERAMLRFRRLRRLQTVAAVHASVHNLFISDRGLSGRDTYKQARTAAPAEWRALCAD